MPLTMQRQRFRAGAAWQLKHGLIGFSRPRFIGVIDGNRHIDINNKSKNPIIFIKKFGFTYADVFRILASTDK
ncbi:hypothetical protein [Acinetobacter sp.]|uniref:hypothetical protein n=1 Tax=Acinetobacter sp. TaxID=472 RepID=UPI0035AFE26F